MHVAAASDRAIGVEGPRHLISGLPTTLQVTAENGTAGNSGEWYLLVARSVVGAGTLTWNPGRGVPARASLEIPPVEVRRPTNAQLVIRPGSGDKDGQSVISLRVYLPVTLPLPSAREKVITLESHRAVRELLRLLGYTPDLIRSVEDLDRTEGVLVVRLPEGKPGERLWESVSAWVREGGTALVLDETDLEARVDLPRRLTRWAKESNTDWRRIELTDPRAFPWSGVEPSDLMGWRDDGIVAAGGIRWSGSGEEPKVLATAALREDGGDHPDAADPVPVLVEFRLGEGNLLLSRLRLTGKVEREPFVPELGRRLIGRMTAEGYARKE
jgi:hypothetical protein